MKLGKLSKKILMTSLILSSIALVGCTTNNSTNKENNNSDNQITVQHKLGTTKLNSKPKKIAVLELSFLDSLHNLDIDPVAIADDGESNKVTDVTNGEKIDYVSVGDRKEPNLEELSSMDLDLIIADTSRHSEIYEDLNKIAPTIVLDSIDSSYDEYIENFETIAKIVGKEDVAKTKIEEAEKVLSDVKDKAKDKVSDEEVLTVSPKNDEYTAHTSSSFVGQVLEKAGFKNAIQSDDREASLSLEQLVEINPDIIVYMRDDIDTTIYTEWKDTELYKSLDAVKNNKVYTTVARGPWTQYRGFISVNTLTKEMSGWLLNN
ncbi:MAG: ABC transporter substrate-binding protein [Intestinibacter bartlettii]|uniref:ABC transporter substrate-binding protein n=1 Tax=Intestinibacter bartlettii TaxID=261299 RepID=UPI00242E2EAD|nr:ABC transporter substrate-binding protein [Intestinibacter bartlettii]MBS7148161.1 ABC transporter substrate-binding protein [Intestinibacter bartlettii]